MRINDAVTGAVLLAFAIAMFAYARTLPAIPGQEYGAAVFPMLIATGLAGCGVVMIASGRRRWQGAVAWNDWARTHHAWVRLAVVIALVLAYILAAPILGFVPMSIVILLVFLLMMGVRWWIAAAVAFAATILIQQTFAGLLRVPLPLGLLGP
ncbi:tripartite tricarboxylate transporter TctB family protein [Microvirga makkahensis]|uniref:Tripartite tricarboxylate transporter TctB family protein n=1 Tax=Microvirga makkahensis TaxID=1128670 RepID=A0A7X3SMX8_9HYPH|nr:tripartite tricarboxylate transporter TctB family protein [Microvirga makkahensis]MXQ10608.1 tripartite tricarboxylate transporter TctB family protein [Microvirga makkahensis]